MKKAFCVLLALCLSLTLAGCRSAEDKEYDALLAQVAENPIPKTLREDIVVRPGALGTQEPPLKPLPNDTLSGELTVKIPYWGGNAPPDIALFAEEFMMLHPNVKISFDYPEDYLVVSSYSSEEKSQRRKTAQEKLQVDLMSRKADYIIYNGGYLLEKYYALSESNVLLDMKPYFERDFRREDYFSEILSAFEVDGKMTLLPFSFEYDCAFLNRSVLEEIGVDPEQIDAVTTADLIGWYEQARKVDPDLQMFFSAAGEDSLFPVEQRDYLDLENRQASFDSPECIDFLERTAQFINDDPEVRPGEEVFGSMADVLLRYRDTGFQPFVKESYVIEVAEKPGYAHYRMATRGRRSFATVENVFMPGLTLTQQPLEYMAGPYPLVDKAGRLGITTAECFAVPACVSDPDLAWEFIKYCVSDRENLIFYTTEWYADHAVTFDIPLNRSLFEKLAAWMPEAIKNVGFYGNHFPYFDPVDADAMGEALDKAVNRPVVYTMQYSLSMTDILTEYYENQLTTAEECARKLQERAELWLNEM